SRLKAQEAHDSRMHVDLIKALHFAGLHAGTPGIEDAVHLDERRRVAMCRLELHRRWNERMRPEPVYAEEFGPARIELHTGHPIWRMRHQQQIANARSAAEMGVGRIVAGAVDG